MNQPPNNVKLSSFENPSASTLNNSGSTIILFQICTTNEGLYELRDSKGSLTRRTKDYDAAMTVQWVSFQVKKIVVERKEESIVRGRSFEHFRVGCP
ncbi:MAG: hypothetical protein QOH71_3370 [Blastocatellia bacterium]|jgi:hypothetical protein|nr:hypothetical protein [Blastocatellia bacterium]